MGSKKLKLEIPIVIVEDHNEVLHHIYRGIGSKKIPFDKGCMLHFDSHPDMMIPKNLDASKIYDREHVLNSLSIENWIFPAVFAGHFSTLVWIKPEWSSQLENGSHHFKIGIHEESKEIRVTCRQSYFVSELSWSPEKDLQDSRDVLLEVCTLKLLPQDTVSDGAPTEECRLSKDLEKILSDTPFVLDIDLDFFSTRNPFLSLFTEEQFGILRELYHYQHPTDTSDEALLEATAKRREQLRELESSFVSVRDGTPVERTPRAEAVRSLLSTFPADSPPDVSLLHDAGCTCDDCDLPHHVTARDSIRHLVAATGDFLKMYPKPSLITIARSSRDDYCPPEDVDFIQELVLRMLEDTYGPVHVTRDYEEEETVAAS